MKAGVQYLRWMSYWVSPLFNRLVASLIFYLHELQ